MFLKRNQLSELDNDNTTESTVNTVYGDMMTFLMSLFILLFVLSYNSKDATFFTRMQVKFGAPIVEQDKILTSESIFVSKLAGYLKQEDLEDQSKILIDEQRISLVLDTPVLFDSGFARLKPEGVEILAGLADIFKLVKNPVIIEGHTDDVPISNRKFESNWDLSFHRAYSVIKYFIQRHGYDPKQLSAIGYGEYQPIAPNDNAENRSRNRRIELNVIRVGKAESTTFSN